MCCVVLCRQKNNLVWIIFFYIENIFYKISLPSKYKL